MIALPLDRILWILWGASVLAGLAILLLPETPLEPLVAKSAWEVEGCFFENSAPVKGEVSDAIRKHPEARFFRSWSPETGACPGVVSTAPFELSEYIAVPFQGFPYAGDLDIALVCDASGERLPIAFGNPEVAWIERTMRIPSAWCASTGRLVARSSSESEFVSIGTPFRVSRASYWKHSALPIVFVHFLVLIPLFLLWGTAAMQLRRTGLDAQLAVLSAMLAVCGWGFANFFFSYFSANVQPELSVIVVLACAAYLVRRRADFAELLRDPDVGRVLGLYFALSLLFVLTLYVADNGIGSWAANYRFFPAIWGSDNQLQPMLAEKLYQGDSLLGWNSSWQTSDRPPLLMGVLLLIRPFWEPLLDAHDNYRLIYYFQQITTVCAMAIWVVPVWYLLRRLEQRPSRSVAAFVLVALSSFIWFNTIYTWPKLLAGALATISYLVIIQSPLETGKRAQTRELVIGASAAALALMSHGGVVFGLLPIVLLMLTPRFWPGWRRVLPAAIVPVVLIVPWMLWQQLVDPPGNALVKQAFAGTFGFSEKEMGVIETIRRTYAQMTFGDWAQSRISALQDLSRAFGYPITLLTENAAGEVGALRRHDQFYILTSLRSLNLAWLFAGYWLLASLKGRVIDKREKSILLLLGVGIGGLILNLLFTIPFHIIPHHSYFSVLAILVGLAAAVSRAHLAVVAAVLAIQATYMAIVWVILPLTEAAPIRGDVALGCTIVLASVAARLRSLRE